MPFDLSLPLVAATAVTIAALVTWLGVPNIRVRTYNKTHGDLRVVELAVILSRSPVRAFRWAAHGNDGKAGERTPGAEFVIYMTLKTGNI